jgi:hypothetical protein
MTTIFSGHAMMLRSAMAGLVATRVAAGAATIAAAAAIAAAAIAAGG